MEGGLNDKYTVKAAEGNRKLIKQWHSKLFSHTTKNNKKAARGICQPLTSRSIKTDITHHG